jgi:hypothetical protein
VRNDIGRRTRGDIGWSSMKRINDAAHHCLDQITVKPSCRHVSMCEVIDAKRCNQS